MKCDTCKHQHYYTLGIDECGTGNVDAHCQKGHWDSYAASEPEPEQPLDPWKDCKDYVAADAAGKDAE